MSIGKTMENGSSLLFKPSSASVKMGTNDIESALVLIVDDENDVHTVTKMAFDNTIIAGKKLKFLSAMNLAQAKEIVRENSNIQVILLDIVMETRMAGFELVKYIRESLLNDSVRIIVRTGQPGEISELDAFQKYDINEYAKKGELTIDKLESLLTLSLRTYSQIEKLKRQVLHGEKLRVLGQLAAGIVHDFNNQLSMMVGYLELLSELTEGNPEGERLIGNVFATVKNSAKTIEKLMAFSRESKFIKVPINLQLIFKEISEIFSSKIRQGVTISLEGDFEHSFVSGDKALLENVFLNFFLNSSDAMNNSGQIKVTLEKKFYDALTYDKISADNAALENYPELKKTGNYFHIVVCDEGCGMTKEVLSHALEPFFTTKEPGKGTGMGLSSAFGTIQLHGGEMSVESEPGKGTCVHVYLPEFNED